jgi:hypothetical protein
VRLNEIRQIQGVKPIDADEQYPSRNEVGGVLSLNKSRSQDKRQTQRGKHYQARCSNFHLGPPPVQLFTTVRDYRSLPNKGVELRWSAGSCRRSNVQLSK